MTETYRRKLIEVALPLEAINAESAREKSIRHGHPSTLHLWWARRPLAACRVVLFSSLVDDPSEYCPDEESARTERERMFKIIEDLVKWENVNNEEVLDKAKLEIARSVARDLGVEVPVGKQAVREFLATQAPPVLDPFAGGGSIPLEAQRLGLRAYASDLNPVAVLINKALIEIPPKFSGKPPIHPPEKPETSKKKGGTVSQSELWKKEWDGAKGLAEDVRYYGKWLRDEAFKRIGYLYPPVQITEDLLAERPDLKIQGLKSGDKLTVIAWLWARTVKCPNPACGTQMPLARSFVLATKKGKQAWVEPRLVHETKPPVIHFSVRLGAYTQTEGTVSRTGARCLACGTPVSFEYVRTEGKAGRMDAQMMAIVAEGKSGRIYLPPNSENEALAHQAQPEWQPDQELQGKCRVSVPLYGMETFGDLFTPRQLVALDTLSGLINELRILNDDHTTVLPEGSDPKTYADAIATYLAFAVDRVANYSTNICSWNSGIKYETITSTFARQAIPMTWDFVEGNPFSNSSGNFFAGVEQVTKILENVPGAGIGVAQQIDATSNREQLNQVVSTDPPYYDNICYADLSDFFYVWLRRSLSKIYPDLFATLLVPKAQELVATPYRFDGDRRKAEAFFEDGLRRVFINFRQSAHLAYPLTVYYAFRQSEAEGDDNVPVFEGGSLGIKEGGVRASTGWETMLEGLLSSNFEITGTWPMRTELISNLKKNINALATSVVVVCRPRPESASIITRRDFLNTFKRELPLALHQLQQGSVAPVDFAQAAIGPGMAVFSRYKQVLEADGSPMRVRTALGLINQALDEFLAEQEGEYDGDTRWALAWYEQYGHEQGPYGVAETLSKAKNTTVEGLVEASILEARAGKVRLLRRDELNNGWDPQKDKRPTAWEACQHLIYNLDKNGEQAAAVLLAKLGSSRESARDLAYRLYTICERKGWAQDALGYNMLVVAWPRLKELARDKQDMTQKTFF